MKKVIIIAVALVVLLACLAVAHWADQNTRVPAPSTTPGSSTGGQPLPSGPAPTPGDIDNGLGWG